MYEYLYETLVRAPALNESLVIWYNGRADAIKIHDAGTWHDNVQYLHEMTGTMATKYSRFVSHMLPAIP